MDCLTCGAKVKIGETQCQECGELFDSVEMHEKKPLAVLRPVLIIWLIVARYFILQVNMTFVGGACGGAIIFLHHLSQGTPLISLQPFLYSALFFFLAIPIVAIFIHKRTYDLTRYVFYTDYLEYYEGFWNVEQKIINYKSITEVKLKQTVVQRLYHLGTIQVLVPSIGEKQAGIMITDVKNPEKAYQFLQKMARKH